MPSFLFRVEFLDLVLVGRLHHAHPCEQHWAAIFRGLGDAMRERPDPWHRKPHQRGGLKRKAKTECGLIGSDRIMSVLRRPLLDHEPNAVLHRERPAEVQEIQGAIGARGKFPGEVTLSPKSSRRK